MRIGDDAKLAMDLCRDHSRWLGWIERRPSFGALASPASSRIDGFRCRRDSRRRGFVAGIALIAVVSFLAPSNDR